MQCPNCNHIERDELWGEPATCPKCSVIYEKALRAKQVREQQAALARQAKENADKQPRSTRMGAAMAGVEQARAERKQRERSQTESAQNPTHVIVTDIKMPFWSIVTLMVKVAIASIPAFIILFALSKIFWGVLMAL